MFGRKKGFNAARIDTLIVGRRVYDADPPGAILGDR